MLHRKRAIAFCGFSILLILQMLQPALASSTRGRPISSKSRSLSAEHWLEQETSVALSRIYANVSPSDGRRGAVVAAQTRSNPDYYFHWVRDAALTMEALIDRYNFNTKTGRTQTQEQRFIGQKLLEYFEFSEKIQNTRTISGLGEPKFRVDGSSFDETWGRPQNDGPALRALSFIHLARILINEGQLEWVRTRLYNGRLYDGGVIKRDLEYVSHHWREPSYDLWEEVMGDHFYTRMVQRRALLEGAELAKTLDDHGAANWYSQQAFELERNLNGFWDSNRNQILTTRNRVAGLDYKSSQVDAAVILGLLHGSRSDGFLSFSDSKVQATMNRLVDSFRNLYPINRAYGIPGVGIGRYPEDRYGGSHFDGGNPWILTTLAMAEAYYRMAVEFASSAQSSRARELIAQGDEFVLRVKRHAYPNGSLSEQFDRNSGYMTSVEDLTWNYATVLTTYFSRLNAMQAIQ